MKNKEIIFSGLTITISESLLNYSSYQSKFKQIALEKKQYFNKEFYSKFNNMDELAEQGFYFGLEIIKTVIDIAVSELVNKGMYDVNDDYFIEEYVSRYFEWENGFNQILDKYSEICLTQEEAQQYREHRKNNRSKWGVITTSGDYGKAVDAQMTAGMWNIAEGIGHSIFNAIGNAASKANAKAEKKELFSDISTLQTLSDSLYQTCYNIHFALIDALNENLDVDILNREQLLKSQSKYFRLLENLIKGRVPKENMNSVICDLISIYPYENNLYQYLLDNGFDINEVASLASEFSMDIPAIFFGISFDEIQLNYEGYDFEYRSMIVEKLASFKSVNPKLDSQISKIKEILLTFNGNKLNTLEDLKLAMNTENSKMQKIINLFKVHHKNDSLYIENIPKKKEENAREYYGIPKHEKIFILIDDTVMGSAKKGIAFCRKGIYLHNVNDKHFIKYSDFQEIVVIHCTTYGVMLTFSFNMKIELDLSGSQFKKKNLLNIMHDMVQILTGFRLSDKETPISYKTTGSSTTIDAPKNWKIESILMIFFNPVFGLVALESACKVKELHSAGQYKEAIEASEKAKNMILIGFLVSLSIVFIGIFSN
jgi:adenosyl cobinamide kinase/adenosyl cobinamide phosphate guanylyltransferase